MNNLTLIQFQYKKILPTSVVYLAASLEKEKIDFDLKLFDVHNFYKSGSSLDMLFYFLADSKDIIAIGCFSDMLPYVLVVLQKIKYRWPQKIIILGGIGPSIVTEEILDAFDFIDFIIKGPGSIALPRLIKKISENKKDLGDLPMVYTRNKKTDANIHIYDFASDIPTITSYDFIRDIRLFDKFLIKTSSGCPYQCTFCYARPVVDRKITYRGIDEVMDEIKAIKRQRKGKFILSIFDEAFVVNRNRVIEFCGHLRKHKLNIKWVCYGRVNCMDKKLLKIMFDAGCREVYYGIESGSNQILQKIKKGFSIEEAIDIALVTKKVIPKVTASFIYRYPLKVYMIL